uniref:Uncharacterized protein n=1 Tax=Anopheles culicifacies TaxID=139723 RepID=A0A182MUW6_9DIPT
MIVGDMDVRALLVIVVGVTRASSLLGIRTNKRGGGERVWWHDRRTACCAVCQQQGVPVAARYRMLAGEDVTNATDAVSTVTVAAVATVTVASVTVHIYDITGREQATARNQHAPRRMPNVDRMPLDQLPEARTTSRTYRKWLPE